MRFWEVLWLVLGTKKRPTEKHGVQIKKARSAFEVTDGVLLHERTECFSKKHDNLFQKADVLLLFRKECGKKISYSPNKSAVGNTGLNSC